MSLSDRGLGPACIRRQWSERWRRAARRGARSTPRLWGMNLVQPRLRFPVAGGAADGNHLRLPARLLEHPVGRLVEPRHSGAGRRAGRHSGARSNTAKIPIRGRAHARQDHFGKRPGCTGVSTRRLGSVVLRGPAHQVVDPPHGRQRSLRQDPHHAAGQGGRCRGARTPAAARSHWACAAVMARPDTRCCRACGQPRAPRCPRFLQGPLELC